jgi:nucleotide-binding universal stress UspA family protein
MTNVEIGSGPILVPVDFSPHSAAALLWAAEAARRFDAPLLVLHVVHDPGAAPGYYTRTGSEGHLRRLEESAEIMLDEFLRRIRRDHPELDGVTEFHRELVVGLPANRILEVAERSGARMIVMGSQGRTGLAHLLLGSKAERVVQLSPIPVTIVKAEPPIGGAG